MRRTLLTLLTISLLTAGCFGGDDDDGGSGPVDTTPTPTPTPTATPPTNATPTPATPTPTPAPAPEEVFSTTVNFARAPPQEPTTETFEVKEGFSTITLNVTWSVEPAGAPITATDEASVTITGPGGSPLSCAAPAAGPAPAEPVVCTQVGTAPAAGEWTASFAGAGTWDAEVVVTAS